MKPDVDIAILGAGCAGLSLAAALGQEGVPGNVMLLDSRQSYTRDRTWCFWNTEEHPFVSAISHSWNSWRVTSDQQQATQQSRRYRYCHVAGDAFYELATAKVAREPNQQLCLGTSVASVQPLASGLVAVETSDGRLVARKVFDGRPPSGASAESPSAVTGLQGLTQRFVGWHVRTAGVCFDPETVDLMHFLPSPVQGRTRFLYLLPFSSTEALVEMTYLDDPGLPHPPYQQDLEDWLGARASSWEVLHRESGSLPMRASVSSESAAPNVHAIGIRGGRLKPSSGYAFLRIQRHSRAIAEALRLGRPVPTAAESPLYPMMDSIFLRALQTTPAAVPALFLRMFAGTLADELVRFLSECSTPEEMLRVAWSLPKLPMVRAGFESLVGAL